MLTFLGILLTTVVAYIIRFHYDIVRALYLSMKISGPRAYPLIGNGLMFINNTSAGIFDRNLIILFYFLFFRLFFCQEFVFFFCSISKMMVINQTKK